MSGERHQERASDVHQSITGVADRSALVCPSCRAGTLSFESHRCACPECGLEIDDVVFVLLHQDSSAAARRRRMWAVLASVKLALACGLMFMIAVAFDIEFLVAFSVIVAACTVFGLAAWSWRNMERRGAADVVTEHGIVSVREGAPMPMIPWSDMEQWRLTRSLTGRRRLAFGGADRLVFDFAPVPPALVGPLEAFLRRRAPQAAPSASEGGRRASRTAADRA